MGLTVEEIERELQEATENTTEVPVAEIPTPKAKPKQPLKRTPAGKPSYAHIEQTLLELHGFIGLAVNMRCEVCGTHIIKSGERNAAALVNLAKENKSVKKVLEALSAGSAWTAVTLAMGQTLVPIGIHHGWFSHMNLPFGTAETVEDHVHIETDEDLNSVRLGETMPSNGAGDVSTEDEEAIRLGRW